jgi:hypothetical protein
MAVMSDPAKAPQSMPRLAALPLTTLALLTLCSGSTPVWAAAPIVAPFSHMNPGGAIGGGWQPLRIAPHAKDTLYSLVRDTEQVVLRADANNAMSAMSFPLRVNLRQYPLMRWRWKVSGPVASANMLLKSGDDYAARVYVMFDLPSTQLGLGARLKQSFGEAIFRKKIPNAVLSFVWDNKQPAGTHRPNIYSDRVGMVVQESGNGKAGMWVSETVDLAAHFKTAFAMEAPGLEVPDVVAIAVASDTDNTGESITAWYGDIEFLAAPGPAVP